MTPRKSTLFVAAGLILAGAFALLQAASCTQESPEDDPTGAPGGVPDATQRVIDELFGGSKSPEPGAGLPPLPVLELVAWDAGLPRKGTWRERPLLHDFTADGRDDLVASNREEDGLSTWEAPGGDGAPWILRIAEIPRDLMYGGSDGADLDGDGDQDLVFAAHGAGITVFLNDGEMGWTAGPAPESPFLMLDVCLGNLDGDGQPDAIAIGHFEGGVCIYLGDGEAGFRRLPQSVRALGRSRFGTRVELADLDGDGLDDILATAEWRPHLLYTRRDADGGELRWEDLSDGLPRTEIGNALRGVAAVDVEGDGVPEIAICRKGNPGVPKGERNNVGVYRRDEGGAWTQIDGGLPRELSYNDLAVVDLDRDGHADLVLVSYEYGVTVHLGDGSGEFELAGALPDSVGASKVGLGDANGDGWDDVAVLAPDKKGKADAGGLVVFLNGEEIWAERGK